MKKIKFDFINEKGFFSIKISGDIADQSIRSEGARNITLKKDTYEAYPINGDFHYLSNNSKALCAILCFHPSLPDEEYNVDFGFSISETLSNTLKRPYLTPNANYVTCDNNPIDDKSETVISYGGGFDSLAAHCLFPSFKLIHQTPMNKDRRSMQDSVNKLLPTISSENGIVKDNMRELYSVWGLPLWVSVFVPSILFGAKNIISGSELTGTYLEAGKKFHPRYRNLWYRVFKDAGVNIYATSFLSEIGNTLVCHRAGVLDLAAYCQFIKFSDCGQCTKCLRRRLIKDAISDTEKNETLDFRFSDKVEKFLNTSPLYYGDIFAYCLRRSTKELPPQLKNIELERFSDVSFLEKYYPDAFMHFAYPDWLEKIARDSLQKYNISEMDIVDKQRLENYSQKQVT